MLAPYGENQLIVILSECTEQAEHSSLAFSVFSSCCCFITMGIPPAPCFCLLLFSFSLLAQTVSTPKAFAAISKA